MYCNYKELFSLLQQVGGTCPITIGRVVEDGQLDASVTTEQAASSDQIVEEEPKKVQPNSLNEL